MFIVPICKTSEKEKATQINANFAKKTNVISHYHCTVKMSAQTGVKNSKTGKEENRVLSRRECVNDWRMNATAVFPTLSHFY